MRARAFVTATVAPGQCFVPMHFARTNQLTDAVFDKYWMRNHIAFACNRSKRSITLDLKIQQEAEMALQKALPGQIVRGAVVVMDPNTGDILAMVSTPSFDPNVYIPRLIAADWRILSDEVLKPQMNLATLLNYAPGSIF